MCLLRRLVLIFELPGAVVPVAVHAADGTSNVTLSCLAKVHAVSTHVSYMSILIQLLGDEHCLCNAVAQLSRSFLLQRGGCEWRSRRTLARLYANVRDLVFGTNTASQKLLGVLGRVLLFALGFESYRLSGYVVRGESAFDLEMTCRLKCVDLAFPIGDQAYCDALHPACT